MLIISAAFAAFGICTAVVALGEMGDKTQLLALLLAARYRKPWPIMAGILVATLLNHGAASSLGTWLSSWVNAALMPWLLGLSFLAVAAWMLVPDKADDGPQADSGRWGVFGVTTVAFFLAEMGDKTQIATIMLGARYAHLDQAWLVVTAGTTLGMVLANAPVVWLGDALVKRISIQWVHRIAAAVFAAMGLALLLRAANLGS